MKTLAITLCFCWLAATPILAQENSAADPLIFDKQLSEWTRLLSDETP